MTTATEQGAAAAWPDDVLRGVREAVTMRQARPEAPPSGFSKTAPLGEWMGRAVLAGRFKYAPGMGWLRWDGRRWERVDPDVPMKVLVEAVEEWVRHVNRTAQGREERQHAAGMLNEAPLVNVLAAARRVPEVRAEVRHLDLAAGHLNVGNGIVDLRTGVLRPHDRDALFTKVADVDYEPGASHPLWDQALEAFVDVETTVWTQTFYGAAAAGEPGGGSVMPLMHGGGSNGKSTIVTTVKTVLGDFAVRAPDAMLEQGGHPTKMMPLRGARLAYVEELDAGHVLPTKALKDLVDTPEITAHLMRRDFVTWTATHHLVVNTNFLPLVTEYDHGTWRRLTMVPFPHTFEVSDFRDRVLEDPGVAVAALAWIVEGARRWYENNRKIPEPTSAMQAKVEEWQSEMDALGDWLTSSFEVDKAGPPQDVQDLREEWNNRNRASTWGPQLFGQRLKSHRFVTGNPEVDVKRVVVNGKKITALVGVRRSGVSVPSRGQPWGTAERPF